MKALGGAFVPVIPALEIKLVSLGVLGIAFGQSLLIFSAQL
jgi:hypothetical protein